MSIRADDRDDYHHHEPHGHDEHGMHGHGHGHAVPNHNRAFAWGLALNAGLVVAEIIAGFTSHSLALLADAGHNVGDVFGLLLAWGATHLAASVPVGRRTYGWRKLSIMAAMINASVLLVVSGALVVEAVDRFIAPEPVSGMPMMLTAAVGVLINAGSAMLFMSGRDHDINIRSAFMHLAADALISLGVVVAGVIVYFTHWTQADPIVSIVVSLLVIAGTWSVFRESIYLNMDSVPSRIKLHEVNRFLAGLPGVTEVHDLHIWSISTTEVALTVHLVMMPLPTDDAFVQDLSAQLSTRFGIGHVTIQIEYGTPGVPCKQAPAHVV